MANYRIVFLLNTLAVLLVALVSFALNGFGSSVKGLFFPPCLTTYPGRVSFFDVPNVVLFFCNDVSF
jgi:hypothetical protein